MRYGLYSIFIFSVFWGITSCSSKEAMLVNDKPDGLYAIINTDKGVIIAILFYDQVPLTVTNFAGLAAGKIDAPNRQDAKYFYDGLKFHRVVPNFVIQGGDPKGDGTGGPGYKFNDEFSSELRHDTAGILSMANSGPNTNGSQFFITLDATSWLDDQHSVFGRVVEGMDIVESIAQEDVMNSVRIIAKGKDAKSFLSSISQENFNTLQEEHVSRMNKLMQDNREKVLAQIQEKYSDLTQREDGIFYKVLQEGSGDFPKDTQQAETHFVIRVFGSDTDLDNSYKKDRPITFTLGENQVISGWEIMVKEMRKGEKRFMILPPEHAYKSRGIQGIVPPNSFVEVEVELIDIKS